MTNRHVIVRSVRRQSARADCDVSQTYSHKPKRIVSNAYIVSSGGVVPHRLTTDRRVIGASRVGEKCVVTHRRITHASCVLL